MIHIFIFCYIPMYGVLIAFQDYHPGDKLCSITQSHWVGLKHFINFVTDPYFSRLVGNTVWLNILCLVFGFAAPIIFALLLNEITCSWYKKFVQTASYMPHFISSVIVVGMVFTFVNGEGIVNDFLALFGVQRSSLLVEPKAFPAIFVTTSVWKSFGWGSILYLSNITSIDPGLYESARLDGANRGQRMWYITLPHLKNLILIQLIFSVGGLLSSSTDLILLLYNPAIYSTSDVIGTYVYRLGIEGGKFSQTTAINLFVTVINFALLFICNKITTKVADYGLW
ncbi:MAG: ABC transporter permease subunit [bacterium]|nr:ABC transporter permease subunit [bacterium]